MRTYVKVRMCALFRRAAIMNEHRFKLNTCFALAAPFSVYTISRKIYIFEHLDTLPHRICAGLFDGTSIGDETFPVI